MRTLRNTAHLGLPLLLAFAGCGTENEIHIRNDTIDGDMFSIYGRVCDFETESWLEGALVYTNVFTDSNVRAREWILRRTGRFRLLEQTFVLPAAEDAPHA